MPATPVPPSASEPNLRPVARVCVRPACGRPAVVALRFDYAQRTVMLDPLEADAAPGAYDLCSPHAARSGPPAGWTLRDRAPAPDTAAEPAPPVGPDRDRSVDRLAAALSAVRRVVSEDAPDAAPGRVDRPADPSPARPAPTAGTGRLDALLGAPRVAVGSPPPAPAAAPAPAPARPQPLRLAPDPTTTVWCADLLGTTGTAAPVRS